MASLLLVFTIAACTGLSAAERPSFSGTWAMDPAKSDFGPLPGPSKIVDHIRQSAAGLEIERDRDGQQLTIVIPVDGTEKTNLLMGVAMKTKGHWEKSTLVVEYAGERRGNPVSFVERWALSPGRTSYQVSRHLTGPQGETDQTLSMVKQ